MAKRNRVEPQVEEQAGTLIVQFIIHHIEASPMSKHDKEVTHQQMLDSLEYAVKSGRDLWEVYEEMLKIERLAGTGGWHDAN